MRRLSRLAPLALAAALLSACSKDYKDYWGPEPLRVIPGSLPHEGDPRAPDFDRDGFDDLLVVTHDERDPRLAARVHSSATGGVLRSFRVPPGSSGNAIRVASWTPDADGDGVADLALASAWNRREVLLFSGADGALLRVWGEGEREAFGSSVACPGDLDGDGVPELLVGVPSAPFGEVVVLSVRDDAPRARWKDESDPRFGASLAVLDDLDGDGAAEIAIGSSGYDGGRGDRTTIVSGRTGAILRILPEGGRLVSTDDLNGDGVRELLLVRRGSTAAWSPVLENPVRSWQAEGALAMPLEDLDGDGEPDLVTERWLCRDKGWDRTSYVTFRVEASSGTTLLEVDASLPFFSAFPLADVTADGVGDLAIETTAGLLIYSLGDLRR